MAPMSGAAFAFHEITKTFGTVKANQDVSFSVASGTVHGVVGENGAGKSTIMKILYGMYAPDSGFIEVRGKRETIARPQDAIGLGIGMVHQHFMLVPTLEVWKNLILGAEPGMLLSEHKVLTQLQELQSEYGFQLDLRAKVEDLAVGQQQQVEILKLLYRKAEILILDEPTAVLSPQEVEQLFTRLGTLVSRGRTIVLITHKLKEILRFTHSVTIMRQGKVVETVPTETLNENTLAEHIIGRKRKPLPQRKYFPIDNPSFLELKDLTLERKYGESLHKINLTVRSGEILGVAGIEGNGQALLVDCLAGVERRYQGFAQLNGREIKRADPYALRQSDFALIPPDRHREAAILDFTLEENFALGHHREKFASRHGILQRKSRREAAVTGMQDFDVRPPDPTAIFGRLSGGNQQKLVLARELAHQVKTVVAAHPTRGVDIGAIERIHGELLALRDQGAAILLFSSELEEILALADRIVVLNDGRIVGECQRKDATETQLGLWMTGGSA